MYPRFGWPTTLDYFSKNYTTDNQDSFSVYLTNGVFHSIPQATTSYVSCVSNGNY